MAPGKKLRLDGNVELKEGVLMLTPHNVTLLGGEVPSLATSWKLKQVCFVNYFFLELINNF